ncbi:hypothetical protein [Halobacillus mangrovi]|uniref:GGDEF domain-containing protein n=1 Tax=Halobacillus mangrovi TaxID=402384 RepID=A0A1W5ZT94_9BACI|nr:hypothetical protein [Halobacillus mangrovi]ARI76503.1 hypothetical protein HM131_06480 [Halobacillus mangrovi]
MRQQKIGIAFVLWVVSFVFLFYKMEPIVHPILLVAFLLPVIVFLSFNEKVSFLLFIIFTTGSSLVLLSFAFAFEWTTLSQLDWIGVHAVVLVHLWSSYVIAKWSDSLVKRNRQLSKRILELEEYIADTQILSKREFEKQKGLILTSMSRKKELGALVYINMSKLPPNVKKTSFVKLSDIIYHSIRKHFDIVGKHDTDTIVFLLQNTNANGLEIVRDRILSRLSQIYTEEALADLKWIVEPIGFHVQVKEVHERSRL